MDSKKMIPIIVKEGNVENTWYMDISQLNLSQLLNLREILKGTNNCSVAAIDANVINNDCISDNKLKNTFRRETRRKNAKIRDLSHKYHRR